MEEALETLESLGEGVEGRQLSLQDLQDQLDESRRVLARMKKSNRNSGTAAGYDEVLQHLISAMVAASENESSDKDGDDDDGDDDVLLMSDEEIDGLVVNLEAAAPGGGLQVREDLLRRCIVDRAGRRTLEAIVEVTRNLLSGEDLPAEERIFHFAGEG